MSFDALLSIVGFIYFLGFYLYTLHVRTIFALQAPDERIDMIKLVINSLLWPVHAIEYLIMEMFDIGGGDKE